MKSQGFLSHLNIVGISALGLAEYFAPRRRGLTELARLDSARLDDIGLTEYDRQSMLCPH